MLDVSLFQYIYCYSKLLIGILTCFSVLVIPVLINATAFYLDGWSEEDIFRSSHYQAILFLKTRPLIHVVNYKPLTVVIVGVVYIVHVQFDGTEKILCMFLVFLLLIYFNGFK